MKTSRLQVRPAPLPIHWSVQRLVPPPRSPLGWLLRLHREQAVSVCGGLLGGEMSECPCSGATLVRWNSGGPGASALGTCGHTVRDRDGSQVGIPVALGPANHLLPNRKLSACRYGRASCDGVLPLYCRQWVGLPAGSASCGGTASFV